MRTKSRSPSPPPSGSGAASAAGKVSKYEEKCDNTFITNSRRERTDSEPEEREERLSYRVQSRHDMKVVPARAPDEEL